MTNQAVQQARARLGDVLEFLGLLWEMNHALATTSKRMAVRFGVTGPQRLVIRIVGRFPNISAGRLAEVLHLHPSTLTPVLVRLEGRGLLVRTPDPRDRRRVTVRLTPKGRRLARASLGEVENAVKRVLAASDRNQIETTREMLRRLTEALEQ
jgi:MarR family transcriptional regulator, organic hydroperoxide resistance regulator